MTYLQLINKVMVGLRENTVANVNIGYAAFIGQLVNDAKTDIEDLGAWYPLRAALTGTLTAGSHDLDLTGATTERAYLLRDGRGQEQAWITTVDEERRLRVISQPEMEHLLTTDPDVDNDVPLYISFRRNNDGIRAQLWPAPDQAYTYRLRFVVPQAELADKDTGLLIPAEPVWRQALVRAMEERGEEFSGSLDRHVSRADRALKSAMLRDFLADDMTIEAQ
jgi:hypothetical protein